MALRNFLVFFAMMTWGCGSGSQRLVYGSYQSKAMGKQMRYAVYEPPQRAPGQELPLLVFLHGGGDEVDCWDKAEVGQQLDEAISEGRIPPLVVALPEGDLGFWENWADGSRHYRDWVLDEMMPFVQSRYDTAPCPEGCHLMGISMGGHGALRIALLRPESFSSVTAMSAPILDTNHMLRFKKNFWMGLFIPMKRIWGDTKDPQLVRQDDLFVQWENQEDLKGIVFRMAWGDKDRKGVIKSNEKFHEHLEQKGIQHTAQVFEGRHEWWAWKPAIERAIAVQVGRGARPTE